MKILIVDDIEANRRLLRQMLSRLGHSSIEADNGLTGIEITKQQDVDIVLMDIMMPGLDGYETTKIIKQNTTKNHIPIIFVTSLTGEEALGKSLEYDADDYIGKPINIEILESKLRAHGRIRELTQQLISKNTELVTHNKRLQYEHELISYFFDNALERSYLDNRCIHYYFSPMAAFNGDLMLSKRSPCGGLYVLLGDFTGHGLTAAMGTLPLAQRFFELTHRGLCVGDIARKLNISLKDLLPEELFFAASIVEISHDGKQLELWNGGMPESVITSKHDSTCQTIASQHMPLGILSETEFEAETVQYSLNKDDRLILYTDGIIETKNPQGEEYNDLRLHALFAKSGEKLFELIQKELADFRGNSTQQDDISIVEILCDQLPHVDTVATELFSHNNKLPWKFSTTINSHQIRNTNPISTIVDTLDAALNLGNHKGLIHTILSEVYNNAVNHSILDLNDSNREDDNDFLQYYEQREQALSELVDAYLQFKIEFLPGENNGELLIFLEDGGHHNTTTSNTGHPKPGDSIHSESLHGRGLLILSELCHEISIDNKNNQIKLAYTLS